MGAGEKGVSFGAQGSSLLLPLVQDPEYSPEYVRWWGLASRAANLTDSGSHTRSRAQRQPLSPEQTRLF